MTASSTADQPLRVLLVEDNPGDARLIQIHLTVAGFDLSVAGSLAEARARLAEGRFDVLLLDLSLPDSEGLDTFRAVREAAGEPVIVLTGYDDQEMALRAVGEGAQDYLAKGDVTGELLRRAVRYAVERADAEARLARAQRLQTIGRLAGGIAHDFNNMLTATIGYSELLLEAPELLEQHRDYVREIRRTSRRSSYITQQLLAYSRQQTVRPVLLDVNRVVRDLKGTLVALLGTEVVLHVDLDPRAGRVRADKGQIEQVVLNLVVNAGEAMAGEGRVDLQTRVVELGAKRAWSLGGLQEGAYVLLVVRDTGAGIESRDLPHIFEPFYTTKHTKGTGMGLATVDGIVHQLGGTVVVDSRRGEGAEFRVYLPRHPADAEVAAGAAASAVVTTPETADVPAAGHILLCEDEPTVRRLFALFLRQQGYRVTEVCDGGEALAAAAGDPFDLVIADVVMPTSSGIEVAEVLGSRLPGAPGMPVILMTGFAEQAHDRGDGVTVLQKPFPLYDLLAAVRAALPESKGAHPS